MKFRQCYIILKEKTAFRGGFLFSDGTGMGTVKSGTYSYLNPLTAINGYEIMKTLKIATTRNPDIFSTVAFFYFAVQSAEFRNSSNSLCAIGENT